MIIPIYDALRRAWTALTKQSTAILTNSRHRPWTENGFGSAFNRAKIERRYGDRDPHFHDLRGTAATAFYVAGLSVRVIAKIMGWEEGYVEKSSAAISAATPQPRRTRRPP